MLPLLLRHIKSTSIHGMRLGMIIRNEQLILLNQTIAYKNSNLEFVDFTENLLEVAGFTSEEAIIGKRDDGDLPWNAYAAEYQAHDKDALNGINYGAVVPFSGNDKGIKGFVFCTRTKCTLEDGKPGVFIHVIPLFNTQLNGFMEGLIKNDPQNLHTNYYIGKNLADIQLTNKESECLFYLMRGKSSKVIANLMHISCRTVEFHIDNLKHKFACRSKGELISSAIQKGYMSIIPDNVLTKNLAQAKVV
jgi:DNA-binding CsgD family transcriptional regulator